MIIYNVTIKLDIDAADAWVNWMKTEHMSELMNTGLFTDCRLCRLLEQDEAEGVTYSAQYTLDNMDDYNTYIDKYAVNMREKGFKLFKGKFAAFRTVMEVV
jgi:hypothetical protein